MSAVRPPDRAAGWGGLLPRIASGALLYLIVSGLPARLFPRAGAFTEWSVLLHTAGGLLSLAPVLLYLFRHWRDYRPYALTPSKVLGYLGLAGALVAEATGLWLLVAGLASYRVAPLLRTLHLAGSLALLGFLAAHLLPLARVGNEEPAVPRARRGFVWTAVALPVVALLLAVPLTWLKPLPTFRAEFPADYRTPWGAHRPFAPSLARTADNRALPVEALSGSASCGTAGCHTDIYDEWAASAHRYAALDPAFQAVQNEMAKQNGPESTRYCGGCHDPISLFAGAKMVFAGELTERAGLSEGVSCLACHAVRQTDLEGNANYVVTPPPRYLFETGGSRAGKLVSDFLIRTVPDKHVTSLSKRLFKTPEYCAACHKQFVDQEINRFGWVQLQNQYDNWRKSRWNHGKDPAKTVECRECHMPLLAGAEPAAGDDLDYNRRSDDGRHRSHRFLAANQWMPALLKLPGADEQVRLTEEWLRGRFEIPEIRDKWAAGSIVSLQVEAPPRVRPGESVPVTVHLASNKVGHDFPTGPLDLIQSWVELTVTDASGLVEVYRSGLPDQRKILPPGTFMFKAEPVDRYGNLIDRHNLWEMVGVRWRRSLFPGQADAARYSFTCPGTPSDPGPDRREMKIPAPEKNGKLTVTARLCYRKLDQYLIYFLFGQETTLSAPVTVLAESTTSIEVDG